MLGKQFYIVRDISFLCVPSSINFRKTPFLSFNLIIFQIKLDIVNLLKKRKTQLFFYIKDLRSYRLIQTTIIILYIDEIWGDLWEYENVLFYFFSLLLAASEHREIHMRTWFLPRITILAAENALNQYWNDSHLFSFLLIFFNSILSKIIFILKCLTTISDFKC